MVVHLLSSECNQRVWPLQHSEGLLWPSEDQNSCFLVFLICLIFELVLFFIKLKSGTLYEFRSIWGYCGTYISNVLTFRSEGMENKMVCIVRKVTYDIYWFGKFYVKMYTQIFGIFFLDTFSRQGWGNESCKVAFLYSVPNIK